MKKLFLFILFISVLLIMSACESTEIVCDINQYANISSQELVSILGEPNEIREGTTLASFVEIPCVYYDYNTAQLGESSFLIVNDKVVKFYSYNSFPMYRKDKILASLNVKKTANSALIVDNDAAIRYRCLTDNIDDLWITNINGDTYGFLSVTYNMMYFEEWYLPMSVSQKSDYQYWTQEYVKSILKSPKSADFPYIGNWSIVKNDFYIAAQSYVDAVNSFGTEIRSEFTFVYLVGSSTPIYAIFDGECILDNGYISTADLVKQKYEAETIQTDSKDFYQTDTVKPENNTTPETVAPEITQGKNESQTNSVTVETSAPVKETNNINDLEYIMQGTCEKYNSGDTVYNGRLYATVNSARSVTIEHYVIDLIPENEKDKLDQMEESLKKTISDTLNNVFPETIDVYVYTTATIIEGSGFDTSNDNLDLDGIVDYNDYNTDTEEQHSCVGNEWISSTKLKDISGFSSYWAGEEIWIYGTVFLGDERKDVKYTLTGSPRSKIEKNITYECQYNGQLIRVQYDGELLFNYEDLCDAGIIE